MYNKNIQGRAGLTPEFENGVKTFIEWAKGHCGHMDGDKIRCSCQKCKNTKFETPDKVSYHLYMRGFMPNILIGLRIARRACMIILRLRLSFQCRSSEPQLAMLRNIAPDHTLSGDYYSTKLVKNLGLPVEKIDAYKNGCKLYWKDDVDLEYCKFCRDARYSFLEGETYTGRSPRMLSLGNYHLLPIYRGCILQGRVMTYIRQRRGEKRLINVYLELLIEELRQLWHVGVRTYDHARDNAFIMWAALMWTVNDLHAYGMAVSDHKWTKKSIFWDLPYWLTLLMQYILDVMHIEKNVFNNIFNMVMDIKGKTKDNMNARRDLKIICNRQELELNEHRVNVMPKAVYTLAKEQKRGVCEWIRGLKFPEEYTSNLACCFDMKKLRMHGMKSHNCHVFM
ncbi:UNVERIFIED_CONTAM: hypothetical protein Sradi_4147000 [Sesamum radiatum]|uniref:Transposase-associated domain-containing protein n=1 Tax=Sesamum radiatum TaxID=300843 RepID=A0AAW2P346_SESRA